MFPWVPGRGAVDACHEVLTKLEDHTLDGTNYCGGVADIAKFFDQIRRPMMYMVAEASGMPKVVLRAYKAYLETLVVYNVLAGGMGHTLHEQVRHPARLPTIHGHGCPHHEAVDHTDANDSRHRLLHPG